MPALSVNTALRYLHALFAGRKAEGQSDQYLLERFTLDRDEAAFAALVQRHGPMTLGVCMRILQDEHLAEDAMQATFLVLAVKAGSIRKQASLASWLYGVALRLARKLKGKSRRGLEPLPHQDLQPIEPPPQAASQSEERSLLDEELQRLPEKYRLPLLLCYIEGRTQEEAAAQLGWTPGQVKGLLDRGRERLRKNLIRRGLSSAAVAAVLSGNHLTAAVPKTVTVATIKAGMNLVSAQSLTDCGVSEAVATLVKGELVMGPKKILLILALVFLTGTIAVAAGMWSRKAPERDLGGEEAVIAEQKGPEKGKDKDGKKKDKDGKKNGSKDDDPKAKEEDAVIGGLIEILKNNKLSRSQRDAALKSLTQRQKQCSLKAEEAMIDGMIEILKDDKSTSDQRVAACVLLGQSGKKAKRAEPEMVKRLEQLAKGFEAQAENPGHAGRFIKLPKGVSPENDKLLAMMTTGNAEVGGGKGGNSKEAIAVFSKILDCSAIRYSPDTNKAAAIALGMNCTEETFAILQMAGRNQDERIRLNAVVGLATIMRGPDSKLTFKAMVDLRVLEETDDSAAVKAAAREILTGKAAPAPLAEPKSKGK